MEQAARLVAGRGLDILVNNAGVAPFASTADMTPEVFDRPANINMRGVFFVTRDVLPLRPFLGRSRTILGTLPPRKADAQLAYFREGVPLAQSCRHPRPLQATHCRLGDARQMT